VKSIKTKIERAMIVVALLPVLALGVYVYFSTATALKQSSMANLERQAELISHSAYEVLAHVPGDIAFIRDSASMFQYGRALVIKDQKLLEVNGRSLARDFLSLAKNRRIYNQLRFIDAKGVEQIRVEHNEAEGFSRILQPEQLRDKSRSPYFQAAAKMEFGQIYISDVDLNREDGQIEAPKRPTIRFATPIFAVGNRLVGVLILNVDADAFLNPIRQATDIGNVQFSVIDDNGYYLANSQADLEWGAPRDFNHGANLATQTPALASLVSEQHAASIESGEDIVALQPLYADANKQHLMGRLVASSPKSVVLKLLDSFITMLVVMVIVALILAIIIAKVVAKTLTSKLEYLTRAAEALSKGDVDSEIKVNSGDEIQTLAEAFERLRESIKIMMRL
jgi:HAMP domain-containing protein